LNKLPLQPDSLSKGLKVTRDVDN